MRKGGGEVRGGWGRKRGEGSCQFYYFKNAKTVILLYLMNHASIFIFHTRK